jgi:DUF1365 family protein
VSSLFDPPAIPSLVVGKVSHTRRAKKKHSFTYRHYQWLVDTDDLPQLPRGLRWLARFDARDHLDGGRLGGGIRGDVDRYLRNRGSGLDPEDKVLMLAHARMLGYAFDSLSAFWCVRADGTLKAAIVEVHNTYGDRHAYLLQPDEVGRAEVAKELYVSPFNNVSGTYTMRLQMSPARIAIFVGLDRDGHRVIDAAVSGHTSPASTKNVLRTIITHGLMPQRTTFLIRMHGLWLWARRLPVEPRPQHSKETVR